MGTGAGRDGTKAAGGTEGAGDAGSGPGGRKGCVGGGAAAKAGAC